MKLIDDAKVRCKDTFREFAECSKESGLLVVVRCRRENRASKQLQVKSHHCLT
jgi:hypothetical protein